MTERDRRLENIRENADYLHQLARHYDSLRWMAEQDASNTFLALTEAAGALTRDTLRQLSNVFEIMMRANRRMEGKGDDD